MYMVKLDTLKKGLTNPCLKVMLKNSFELTGCFQIPFRLSKTFFDDRSKELPVG